MCYGLSISMSERLEEEEDVARTPVQAKNDDLTEVQQESRSHCKSTL
jgi:hypothetical protein